ncbi:putative bifunctional diguanylate cyclase/phosphodiesterase [Legionella sainthelensi]|uniref:Bifunctional diguanylate cyclase/phosphodiesterase n=1 Tax=Legionella sainthelensi TaxID=28087 RepID=A0A2H5FMC9_9GAMM|nr:EAL domain-containing protein [Legionella sainthelensi]AUH72711.1 EAL domain-containing protein [Legionella sainthelensi]
MKEPKIFLQLSILFSCLTMVLGGSVLIGWYLGITWLLQYQANTIAMVYNTALSFLIYGLCLLFLLFNYYKICQFLNIIAITLSLLVLLQSVAGVNLHVDELFLYHYYNSSNLFPGRMAPNTSISFLIVGVVILIIGKHEWSFRMGVIASILAIILFFMSLLFASGYFSSLEKAYQWSSSTPMALNTSLGFILLSVTLLCLLLYRCQHHGVSVWPAMPLIIGLGMFLINSLLALSVHEQEYISHVQSLLPLVIFILGTIFTLMFSLLFYYVQQERLRSREEKKLRSLTEATLDATDDGILAWNRRGIITHCNSRFAELWGIPVNEVKNYSIFNLLVKMSEKAKNKENFRELMDILIQPSENHKRITLELKGSRFFEAFMQTSKSKELPLIHVLSFHDMTVVKNLENQMIHRNKHDLITGLPNKSSIFDILDIVIKDILNDDHQFGVFIIDIDRFTQVNDVFGHSKGDQLLCMIAERLKDAVKDMGTLCSLGGDQFVILASLGHNVPSKKIIKTVMTALKPAFEFYDSCLNLSCAVGVAICPQDGVQADELLRCADIAMIRAKERGRNSVAYYTKKLSEYTYERMLVENELYAALENQEFKLFFQPLIELKNQKIIGLEALLRWKNPRLGLLSPDNFLSYAQDLGLLNDIGNWVLNEACRLLSSWRIQGQPLIKISINVTAQQFKHAQLLHDINKALELYDLPSSCLEIELTEQTLIEGSAEVLTTLKELRKKRITIALDDFGKGYSNLHRIKNFPLDKLKIDQSFISNLMYNENNKNLIKAIIYLAQTLNLSVLAEGIENKDQLNFLISNQCTYGQGFLLAKPMPSSDVLTFLKNYKYGVNTLKSG